MLVRRSLDPHLPREPRSTHVDIIGLAVEGCGGWEISISVNHPDAVTFVVSTSP